VEGVGAGYALGAKTDDAGPEARRDAYRKLHAEVARWEAHLEHGGRYLAGDGG
jgi:hypothetical protein